MQIGKVDFAGSPHIGVFCVANDSVAVLPMSAPQKFEDKVREMLAVDIVKTNLADTSLIGILSVATNKLILISKIAEKEEIKVLKDHFPEVIVYAGRFQAVGNLAAANDFGSARSKYLACNGLNAEEIRIAGSDLVGSSIFVNSRGFIVHRDATEGEIRNLERIFKVKGDNCTVNFGDPFVRSGIIGNKNGILAGDYTSGPEFQRISEIFL